MTIEEKITKIETLPNGKEILEAVKTMRDASPNYKDIRLSVSDPLYWQVCDVLRILIQE
jgi:hypothetical protein